MVGGHLEGFLYGKETFFTVPTIERMVKHFKVRPALIPKAFAHKCPHRWGSAGDKV